MSTPIPQRFEVRVIDQVTNRTICSLEILCLHLTYSTSTYEVTYPKGPSGKSFQLRMNNDKPLEHLISQAMLKCIPKRRRFDDEPLEIIDPIRAGARAYREGELVRAAMAKRAAMDEAKEIEDSAI